MYEKLIVSFGSGSKEAIHVAESQIGSKFSSSFADFCLKYNGAKFNDAEILARSSNQGQRSYGVREIWQIEKIGTFQLDPWDPELLAFGEDSSGNFFVFERTDMNAVYFLDHETDQKELVANSFDQFLYDIVDASQSDTAEPRNAKVWVNPAFLKKHKDSGNA